MNSNRTKRISRRRIMMLILHIVAFTSVATAVVMIFSTDTREGIGGDAALLAQDHRVLSAVQPFSRYGQVDDVVHGVSTIGIAGLILLSFYGAVLSLSGFFSYRIVAGRSELAIRRAVGATRSDIRRHLLLEGCVGTLLGVIAGTLLALMGSRWLASAYSMAPLPGTYVLGAVLAFWAVGVLVAFIYAQEAARIAPSL